MDCDWSAVSKGEGLRVGGHPPPRDHIVSLFYLCLPFHTELFWEQGEREEEKRGKTKEGKERKEGKNYTYKGKEMRGSWDTKYIYMKKKKKKKKEKGEIVYFFPPLVKI